MRLRRPLFFPFLLSLSSLSFLSEHAQRDRRRRRRRLRFLLRVSFRRYLLGECLSLSKVIACIETTPPPMTTRYYYGTRRQRRKRRNDEKEPTDEKASSSKNRSLRARTRYINTNICIYIFLLLRNQPTEQRAFESSRIRAKYPDRIPVIVEKSPKSDVPELDKKKYLVPSDLTVGQFVYVIRKRVKLSAEKAIFVFVNNALPPTASLMSTIYEENKDEDGFLYIQYSGENTFGRRCLDDDLKA